MKNKEKDLLTVANLIGFYDAIPSNEWCTGAYSKWYGDTLKRCALGLIRYGVLENINHHLNLDRIFFKVYKDKGLADFNDNRGHISNKKTPKARVIGALKVVKNKLTKEIEYDSIHN